MGSQFYGKAIVPRQEHRLRADGRSLSAPLCLQSTKHVASGQDQKTDQQEREPAVHNRDAEMGVVNNCGDQGDNDRYTERDDLGC